MYFNRTLNDWSKFDITRRTKFDATISSGLAIMAERAKVDLSFARYNNEGFTSQIIK